MSSVTPLPEPENPQAKKKGSAVIKFVLPLLLVLAVIGVAAYLLFRNFDFRTLPEIKQSLTAHSEDITRFGEEVEGNARDISALRTTAADMETRLRELEKKNEELKSKVQEHSYLSLAANDVEVLKSQFDELLERQKENEAKISGVATGRNEAHFAALNSLWLLEYRLDYGLPFRGELRAMKGFVKNIGDIQASLDSIEPFADTGIKTVMDLAGDFEEVEIAIRKIQGTYVPDKNWLQGFLINLGHVASIKTQGAEAESDNVNDIVMRVKSSIKSYDISPAVAELAKLPDAFRPATEEWAKQARARLAAENGVSDIYEQILGSYEKGGSGSSR